MKKILIIISIILFPTIVLASWWNPLTWFSSSSSELNLGAGYQSFQRSLIPLDSTENVGTTTAPWDEGHFNRICLSADCKIAWPTGAGGGGGGGAHSTTTAFNSILYVYQNNATDVFTVGYDGAGVATSTNEAEFSFDPTAKLAVFLNGTKVGIGTTSPYASLSVVGSSGVVADKYHATSTTATSTFAGGISVPDYLNGSGPYFTGLQWLRNPGKLVINGNTESTGQVIFEVNTAPADFETMFQVTDTTVKVVGLECLSVGACQLGSIGNPFGTLHTQALYLSDFTPGLVHYTDSANLLAEDATFAFNDTVNRLTVPYASTTAFSSSGNGYVGGNLSVIGSLTADGATLGQTNISSLVVDGTGGYTLNSDGDGQVTFTGESGQQENLKFDLNGTANVIDFVSSTGVNVIDFSSLGTFKTNSASSTSISSLDGLFVGRTATTTIRGETTATSTFAGGLQGTYLNLTGTSATNTASKGFSITDGCYAIRGSCIGTGSGAGTVTSVATDSTLTGGPITTTGTLGLNLATSNTWTSGMTIFSKYVGIGTSTPFAQLHIASSTKSQITISDGSATSVAYNFRTINGMFYLSTSSPITYATSSVSAFSIDNAGNLPLTVGATTTPTLLNSNSATFAGPLFVGKNTGQTTFTATSTFDGNIKTTGYIQPVSNYISSDGTGGFTGTCTIIGLTNFVVKNGLIVSCN